MAMAATRVGSAASAAEKYPRASCASEGRSAVSARPASIASVASSAAASASPEGDRRLRQRLAVLVHPRFERCRHLLDRQRRLHRQIGIGGAQRPAQQRHRARVRPQGQGGDDGPPLIGAPGQQRLAGGERLPEAAQLLGAGRLGSGGHRAGIGLDQLPLPRRAQRDRRQRRAEDRNAKRVRRPQQPLAGRQGRARPRWEPAPPGAAPPPAGGPTAEPDRRAAPPRSDRSARPRPRGSPAAAGCAPPAHRPTSRARQRRWLRGD